MSPRTRSLALLLAALFLASCASHPPPSEFRPIERSDQPIEHLGIIMYPPPEGTWTLGEKEEEGGAQILFMKEMAASTSGRIGPSTYVSVNIDRIPAEKFSQNFPNQHAALERICQKQAQPSSGRFKDLSCETSWGEFKGQEVARVSRKCEERENPQDPMAVLIVETRSMFVFHPRQPTTVMWLMISQRYPQGRTMPSLASLEEQFLSRLSFK
jgi:hypothetical protein